MNIKNLMICMTALALTLASCKKKTEPAATLPSFHQIWQTADESIDWKPSLRCALMVVFTVLGFLR